MPSIQDMPALRQQIIATAACIWHEEGISHKTRLEQLEVTLSKGVCGYDAIVIDTVEHSILLRSSPPAADVMAAMDRLLEVIAEEFEGTIEPDSDP